MLKRSLPNLQPAAPAPEADAHLLSSGHTAAVQQTDVQPAGQIDVQQPDVHPSAVQPLDVPGNSSTRLQPRPGKVKQPVQMVTYRIPASVYEWLNAVSTYNGLNMTDIVVEAVERHLPNFPQPPGRNTGAEQGSAIKS
jgi:hypothetical protein